MVLSETDPGNRSETFPQDGSKSSLDTYGYEAELTPAAKHLFLDVTKAWSQILPTNPTSTELAALADVCKDSVRDGKVGAVAGLVLFATSPFTVPPLRRFMNALPDNTFSARYPAGSRLNVWLRRMPVLLPAIVVGQFAMFTIASVAFKTSLAMRVMRDPRLSRPNQAMEEWGEKFQRERIMAMRAGEKPPSSLTELMNRQKQRQAQAQGQAQTEAPKQMPTEINQAESRQAKYDDWANTKVVPPQGNVPSMANSKDSDFDTNSSQSTSTSSPWASGSDGSSSSWESTFDDEEDDASPVARSQRTQERRQEQSNQPPMSWDEIRRRATSSNSPASTGSYSDTSRPGRQQQQMSKDEAQRDFDARMDRERQGKDFDGNEGGRKGW